jgi:hypothetical protein
VGAGEFVQLSAAVSGGRVFFLAPRQTRTHRTYRADDQCCISSVMGSGGESFPTTSVADR